MTLVKGIRRKAINERFPSLIWPFGGNWFRVYVRYPPLVISVPVDALAPNGIKPPASTVLTMNLYIFKFISSSMI